MAAPPPPPPPPAPASFNKPNNVKLLDSIHKGIGLKKVPESERNDRSVVTVTKKTGGSAAPLSLPPGSRGSPGSSLSIVDALRVRQEGRNKAPTEGNSVPFAPPPKRAGAPAPNAKVNITTNAPKPPSQISKPSLTNSEINPLPSVQPAHTAPRMAPPPISLDSPRKPFLQTPIQPDSPKMAFVPPPKPNNNSSTPLPVPPVKVGFINKPLAPSPLQPNHSSKPFGAQPQTMSDNFCKPLAPPPQISLGNQTKAFAPPPPVMPLNSTKPFAPQPPTQKDNANKPFAPPPILSYKPSFSALQLESKTHCPPPKTYSKKLMVNDGAQSPRKLSSQINESIIPSIPPPTVNGSVKRNPSFFAPPPPPPTSSMPCKPPPIIATKKPFQNLPPPTIFTNCTTDVQLNRPPLPSRDETPISFDSRFKFPDESLFPDPTSVVKRTKQIV